MRTTSLAVLISVIFPLGEALAEETTVPENGQMKDLILHQSKYKNAQSFVLDMSTPTSPGFAVIGASPTNVTQPGNLQELVIDTASFVENGEIKSGLAINFQPFWLLNDQITLEQYSGFYDSGSVYTGGLNKFQRILARTQISVATVQGASASTMDGARFGIGAQTEVFDGRDPRSIHSAKCQIDAFKNAGGEEALRILSDGVSQLPNFDPATTTDEQFSQLVQEHANSKYDAPGYLEAEANCREEARKRVSASPSWLIGAGIAASSLSGDFDDLDYAGASVWTTYLYPFGKNKFVTLFGQADLDQTVNFNGISGSADTYRAAVSFGFEETDSWKLEATASYHSQNANLDALDDDYFQFSVGGTFKIRDGLWLEGTFGNRTGSNTQDESFSLIQLKVDLSEPTNKFFKE